MAVIMDGREVAKSVLDIAREGIKELKDVGVFPSLVSVLVGSHKASDIHAVSTKRICKDLGVYHRITELPEGHFNQQELEKYISELSEDLSTSGILVQMPLPPRYDPYKVIDKIDPNKDVDCLTERNIALLYRGIDCLLLPPTPRGILTLLDHYGIDVKGKDVVIVGSRGVVGRPLSLMMDAKGATVTGGHSESNDLSSKISDADIIVATLSHPNYLTADMIKEGSVVIDVGINRVDGRIVGDVDFESVKEKASYITPVPGGVGPMTVASLMENVVKACKIQYSSK